MGWLRIFLRRWSDEVGVYVRGIERGELVAWIDAVLVKG
jgi:hypothetical protein